MKHRQSRFDKLHGNTLNVLLLLFVAVLLMSSVFLVRVKLLQNAQSLGMALVQSYAVEEEANISSLEAHLILAGDFVEEIIRDGGTSQDIQSWLKGYFSKYASIAGQGLVDFYAVIDGEIVAANPWEGDATFPYMKSDWYLKAIAAQGQVVLGDVYTDAVTGQKIFTISKSLTREDYVLAMDVYVQEDSLHNTIQSLPDDCSYFLCDKDGSLLYASTKWELDDQALQNYIDYVMEGIADGSLLSYDSFVKDMEGISRGIYYQSMRNGWTVIMTIPYRSILMGEQSYIVYLLAGVALVIFLILTAITILDLLHGRSMKKADDTVRMLGDSFYSIYRVNIRDGNYESIKMHRDLQPKVAAKGNYASLLEAMRPLMRPSTFRTFETSFSLENIRQRIDTGVSDYGEDFQRLFEDGYRWVNIRTLYNQEVAPDEVILCFRYVDEEKRRELQNTLILQDALDAAQKSTKAKSAFFSGMSHDMRTPLNAIIGCCSLAEKGCETGDNHKVREYLKKIQFASNQLLSLINDILELSRLEAGQHNLDLREFNLRDLLCTTADIFTEQAQEGGKTLEVSIDFREDRVVGDEKKLLQIMNNLLSNAVKYTSPGDTIRLDARQFDFQQHSKYQFVVEDTGIGMSPEFLDRLFDPYSRETAFSAHPTTGTGLGMSIVKSLVQRMSGEISVESTLGQGSRFTITLPLKTAAQQNTPAPDIPADIPAEAQDSFDWNGRTVLIAEDNVLNQEIITEVLQLFGAEVLVTSNGQEAVQAFLAQPVYSIDAILMDMQMPVMDGCQAAQAIRRLDREDAGGVPIVAVTANAFAEDIARTTQAGMNDHVSKPIDSSALKQTLQVLILEWELSRGLPYTKRTGGRSGS